jgi:subtilisin family serine protease
VTSDSQSKGSRARVAKLILAAVSALTLSVIAAGAGAAGSAESPRAAGDLQVTALQPREILQGAKTRTARIAESDAALLRRSDARLVNVLAKLDYDSVATYRGGVHALKATSPAKTGKSLKANGRAVRAYERYVSRFESRVKRAIRAKVPSARVYAAFRTVYGGLALRLPANQARKLLAVRGVAAVQADTLRRPQTDVTPEFLGATQVWPSLGGKNKAGQGVIVGVLDTGIWPNHPSFADPGISHPGGTYGCEFGDGSNPELGDPFACNDKLIGAYAFVDTYMAFIGALPGEFCDNDTGECSARDSDGHGTHTASTAAGSPVDNASIFGIDRGSISGMAPGAHVIAYRVCLDQGCFESDSVAAVEQAIEDGVDVINFSISGGANPYSDPVELAFLEAYDAGILANASAGNAGPDAATADHGGPWVNTIGASTSDRHFLTQVHLGSGGGVTLDVTGASVTPGIASATPVIRATDIAAYTDEGCLDPFPAGSAAGKIVVCEGSFSRNLRAYNVFQAGGAGMLLHAITKDLFTDNFWVPTVMLPPAQGDALQAFLDANSGETAMWSTGQATRVRGDVMTNFSSRGPLGDWIKPDVTAPGMEILAGTTPDPHDEAIFSGPPGQYFQAIAGTSMSSPHAAGVSALVRAAHPNWTPGQVKSALMTSSVQDVLKEDGVTAADPFDRGAGSIRANRAVNPTVTFDVTTAQYVAAAADPLGRIHVNTPSVNAPTMPGVITTTRTMQNVSGRTQELRAKVESPAGVRISVSPREVTVGAGQTAAIRIKIDGTFLEEGQYFGQITLDPARQGATDVVLPVAFQKKQGAVALTHECDPTTFPAGSSSACEVQAQNLASVAAEARLKVTSDKKLELRNPTGATSASPNRLVWEGTLSPALAPEIEDIVDITGTPGYGYFDLTPFLPPEAGFGDETIANYGVPAFRFGNEVYDQIGITSNGYVVVGGGTADDLNYIPQTLPDPASPNNVLAPFWTDFNLAEGGGVRLALFTCSGAPCYIVADWHDVPTWSSSADADPSNDELYSFQVWIQTANFPGEEQTFEYGDVPGSGDPAVGATAGAENRDGSSGLEIEPLPAAGETWTVVAGEPTPGGSVTLTYDAFSTKLGVYDVIAALQSNVTPGVTVAPERLTVTGG